jgi:hypothetical protein
MFSPPAPAAQLLKNSFQRLIVRAFGNRRADKKLGEGNFCRIGKRNLDESVRSSLGSIDVNARARVANKQAVS